MRTKAKKNSFTRFVFFDQARTAADMALRLAGKELWAWVPLEERKRCLAEALPLVGALPPAQTGEEDGGGGGEFVESDVPEGPASEVKYIYMSMHIHFLRGRGEGGRDGEGGGGGDFMHSRSKPIDPRIPTLP